MGLAVNPRNQTVQYRAMLRRTGEAALEWTPFAEALAPKSKVLPIEQVMVLLIRR